MSKNPKKQNDTPQEDSGSEALVEQLQAEIAQLTSDLQRTRADFENHARRADQEKAAAREAGETAAVLKLLPVVDNIERAIGFMPEDLADHPWAQGVAGLVKNFDSSLSNLGLERIDSTPGTDFNPEVHDAIQVDEDAVGDREVIAEELQPGYLLRGRPIRHAMVKVTRTKE